MGAGTIVIDAKNSGFAEGDLMVRRLQALSRQCGGLLFLEQSDAIPRFVLPDNALPIGREEWKDTGGA